ncbi:MAG: CopG family antitoxin [Acidobacteriaceae bacterium]|nr:CopG family antitoxin [Acidobacteriaceae bacterium]
MTKLPVPEFTSEAEEANWYDAHRDQLTDYFDEVEMSASSLLAQHDLVLDPHALTVLLGEEDLTLLQKRAAQKGVDSESLLSELVHQALRVSDAA